MKKLILLIGLCIFFASSTVVAAEKINTQKISENTLRVTLNSDKKITVTGYTIIKGTDIIIYFVNDDTGKFSDSINIDLNTVARPYKILLTDAEKYPKNEPFTDIGDNKLKDYILHLYNLGYIDGYSDGSFKPNNGITRSELITLLVKLFDLKESSSNHNDFADLDKNHWAYEYAIKAIDNGLIDGYSENGKKYIKLDNNITIAEAAKIINDAFKLKDNNSFNYDTRFANHWSKQYIQNLVNENIISEKDDFYIEGNIDRPITRGEVSMLLSRALGR